MPFALFSRANPGFQIILIQHPPDRPQDTRPKMEEPVSTDDKPIEETESKTTAAPPPVIIAPHLPVPLGTQPLLDAHLGETLKIMRDYADWVHLPHAPIDDCMRVSDALARLMTASATLATVSARLQKGDPESRHRMIVEYAGPEGEGRPKVENE